jgi:hypothetical protein
VGKEGGWWVEEGKGRRSGVGAKTLTQTQDREKLPLDLCCSAVNLPEELDAGNLHVQFCEGPGPTDIGLRSCGIAGKPGGQQRKQTSTYSIRRNRSTRLNPSFCSNLSNKSLDK